MFELETEIVLHDQVAENVFLLGVHARQILGSAKPGQFVMLRVHSGIDPLLRRPFSICGHKDGEILLILYKVVGQGTEILATKRKGEYLSILGPLGKGFHVPRDQDIPLLVGGGMGMAPLLFLAQSLNRGKFHLLSGFGSKKDSFPMEQIVGQTARPLMKLSVSTDDGSLGFKGLVTDLFQERLDSFEGQTENLTVYACGPRQMLERLVGMCMAQKITCQVSLETYMACGVGACLGCAVKASPWTGQTYLHVCTDGPVFPAEDIAWDSTNKSKL
jgi:dihydroorotate dehydrogenase electron transfer subunit